MADELGHKKNPMVAAFLNFLLNGLGYVYNGNRVFLGSLLIFSELGMAAIYYNNIMQLFSGIVFPAFYVMLLMSFAFAVDGYNEAKKG